MPRCTVGRCGSSFSETNWNRSACFIRCPSVRWACWKTHYPARKRDHPGRGSQAAGAGRRLRGCEKRAAFARSGNIWLDRIAEGYQLGAFESVFSVFFEKTASIWEYLDRNAILVWATRPGPQGNGGAVREDFEGLGRGTSENEWRRSPNELYDEPEKSLEAAGCFQQLIANSLSERGAPKYSISERRPTPSSPPR